MTTDETLEELWNRIVTSLKEEVTPAQYEGFLRHIRPVKQEGPNVHISVPSSFIKDGIEKGLKRAIIRQFQLALEVPVYLFIQIEPNDVKLPQLGESVHDVSANLVNLNPKYRMEYYVVGPTNRFAHAAALAVIKGPGLVYNPLFLWGPVGVGKTHLMQAIGHQILRDHPKRKAMYVTAEVFTSECIDAIREQTTNEFQKKYRTIDLLLIDDVPFFERTEVIQEAFFHTFNELYQKGKQIVLTSDRPPQALNKLQDRLVNRFESGLTADIKPPDLETREAILRELADRQGITIDLEPLQYLAEQFTSNIRELEGSFNRVTAFASLNHQRITVDLIESVLEDIRKKGKKRPPSADSITVCVAEHYHLRREDLLSRRQDHEVILPRQVAMYLMYELAGLTLKQIGQHFGKKDHSTVIHACEKVRKKLEEDSSLEQDIKVLRLRFKESTRET